MAKILLENQNLTQDELLTTLQHVFGARHHVSYSKYPAVKIAVKKSGWCGIAVRKIKQLPQGTEVTYNPFVPSFLANMFLGGVVLQLFLRSAFRELAREFEEGLKDPSKIAEAGAHTVGASASPAAEPANPLREAAWIGATGLFALALPGLVYDFWYFPPIVAGTVATTVAAFGLSFAAPGAGGNALRGVVVGLASGMLGMLGAAMSLGSLTWEFDRWTTPLGFFQLGVFAASGALLAGSQRRRNRVGQAPVTTSGASA